MNKFTANQLFISLLGDSNGLKCLGDYDLFDVRYFKWSYDSLNYYAGRKVMAEIVIFADESCVIFYGARK